MTPARKGDFLVSLLIEMIHLEPKKAEKVVESGAFGEYTRHEASERLDIFRMTFGRTLACAVLVGNPFEIRRPLDHVLPRIKRLLRDGRFSVSEAQGMFARNMRLADVGRTEFEAKLDLLDFLIIDPTLRRNFIVSHPEIFLLDLDYLGTKRQVRGSLDIEDVWSHLFFDDTGAGAPLMDFENQPREDAPKPAAAPRIRAVPPPLPVPEPPPAEPPPAEPPRIEPPPPSEAAPNPDSEQDKDCRMPMTQKDRSPTPCERGDPFSVEIIKLLCDPRKDIGRNRDMVTFYVAHRPWMMDPELDIVGLLEDLFQLGLKGDALWNALSRHSGFLSLGRHRLEHILSFLRERRAVKLPENLDILAIPARIFRERRVELVHRNIRDNDPRYTKALFARTQREFWAAMKPDA